MQQTSLTNQHQLRRMLRSKDVFLMDALFVLWKAHSIVFLLGNNREIMSWNSSNNNKAKWLHQLRKKVRFV